MEEERYQEISLPLVLLQHAKQELEIASPPAFASKKTNHSPMRSVLKQVGKGKVQDGVRIRIKN